MIFTTYKANRRNSRGREAGGEFPLQGFPARHRRALGPTQRGCKAAALGSHRDGRRRAPCFSRGRSVDVRPPGARGGGDHRAWGWGHICWLSPADSAGSRDPHLLARSLLSLHTSVPNLQQLLHPKEIPFLSPRVLKYGSGPPLLALLTQNCCLSLFLSYLTTLYSEVPGHRIPGLYPRKLVLSQLTAQGVKEKLPQQNTQPAQVPVR